jgi:hypothetical protein
MSAKTLFKIEVMDDNKIQVTLSEWLAVMPKHLQIAELEEALRAHETELKNVNDPRERYVISQNERGEKQDSDVQELALMVEIIRNVLNDLRGVGPAS